MEDEVFVDACLRELKEIKHILKRVDDKISKLSNSKSSDTLCISSFRGALQ